MKGANRNPVRAEVRETFRKLSRVMSPITEESFGREVSEGSDSLRLSLPSPTRREYFYLPPLEHHPDFIVIFAAMCQFGQEPWNVDFRVHLYRLLGESEFGGPDGRDFEHFTIRFEGPEPMPTHHYYHAQFTLGESSPHWFPDSIPCLPLAAHNPVTMLVCLMMSLYGRQMFEDLLIHGKINGDYREPLEVVLPMP